MDAETFKCGKHKGKTFRDVRINHTEYFLFLATQPAGSAGAPLTLLHSKFIEYCMAYLRLSDENKWPGAGVKQMVLH